MSLKGAWLTRGFLTIALACASMPAVAQLQRSFLNLGFEQPALTTPGCRVYINSAQVPGWNTTHPNAATENAGGCVVAGGLGTSPGPVIEMWRTPRDNSSGGNVVAPEGVQIAELNAVSPSRIYQNLCLVNGEQVSWRFSHRGRGSPSINDVAELNIDGQANTVVVARTQNDGGTGYTAADCTVLENGVTAGTCTTPTQSGTWRTYSGTFTWSGTSAVHQIGFQAISSAGGDATSGNFIDNIQVNLTPYLEFVSSSASGSESGPSSVPMLVISGVLTSAVTVNMTVNPAGTAALGTDFTTPSGANAFSVTIPAGNYDGGVTSRFSTGVTIVNDSVIENNETVVLRVVPSPNSYTIASTTTCGEAAVATTTYTIVDNDVDLRTTKTASTSTPAAGAPFTYTVTYQNNTAAPTAAPITAHNVVAAISDPVPAGITFNSWTCAASGGASCPAASGNGPVSGNATLPAGSGAAGGTLTYTINATVNPSVCTAIVNTSTITAPAGFQEGASVQANFNSPVSGGAGNNTASASVTAVCADLSVAKTNNVTQVTAGGTTTYTIRVTNNGPASVTGAILSDPAAVGLAKISVACSPTPGQCTAATTPTVAQLESGYALPLLTNGQFYEIRVTATVTATGQ